MSEFRRVSVRDAQTTTASPFTIVLTELENDCACTILAWVIAKQASSNNCHGWLIGNSFVCSGGTLTEVGATNKFHDASSGLASASVDIDARLGTFLDINLTGVAGTTINWAVHAQILVLKLT